MNPDVKSRTVRTIVQGAIAIVIMAVVPILQAALADGIETVDWAVTGAAALTAGIMALLAFIMAELKPPAT